MLFDALVPGKTTLKFKVHAVQTGEQAPPEREVSVEIPKGWNEKTDLADWIGIEPAEQYILQVAKDSPAQAAGIMAKDKVVRINGEDIHSWQGVLEHVKAFNPKSQGLQVTVLREGKERDFEIKPKMTDVSEVSPTVGRPDHRFTIGIVSGLFPVGPESVFYRITNPVQMVKHGLEQTWDFSVLMVMGLVRMVQGEISARNLGGVITIGRVAAHSFAAGWSIFLINMAFISLNLFLINLFPIPILDGGHLVFYAIEIVQGAPLSLKKMEMAQQVGLMLLMALMVFALYNDIANFFTTSWY
jgi:regulator of sigma E protease